MSKVNDMPSANVSLETTLLPMLATTGRNNMQPGIPVGDQSRTKMTDPNYMNINPNLITEPVSPDPHVKERELINTQHNGSMGSTVLLNSNSTMLL